MIQRAISIAIKTTLSQYPIISLTGPRQSGKTTLLKSLLPEYRYVNFEETATRRFFQDDPLGFLKTYDRYVIFDEAQRVPDLFSYLQTKTDSDKIMGQYILSGSQNFLLLENISQSLAGRVAIFRLLPLSHAELSAHETNFRNSDIAENILRGGYPALYDRQLPISRYFENYLETYVERDVRNVLAVKDLNAFQQFIRLCAGRAGHVLNVQSLANDSGVSVATAKNWLSILEASYILMRLSPFFENFTKRLVKSPKIYFYDTGLLCHLLGLETASQIPNFHARGALFENLVITELIKNRLNADRRPQFFFWQDSNQVEVDLVELAGLDTHLYEIKYSYTPSSDFFKGIKNFRENVEKTRQNGQNWAIYAGEEDQIRSLATISSWLNLPNL